MYLRPIALDRPSIVIVDPDRPSLSRLCRLTQSKGYAAVGVETPSVAYRRVQRQKVDLILTTTALSEAECAAWSATLRHLDPNVPVVAMCDASSVHALDLFDLANRFGATAVLRRPFTAATLVELLAQLLPTSVQHDLPNVGSNPLPFDWSGLVSFSTAFH